MILLLGSNVIIFLSKSIARADALGNNFQKSLPFRYSNCLMYSFDLYLEITAISSSVGVPVTLRINSSWWWMSFPGKNVYLPNSSAKMHPQDHTSIDFSYFLVARRNSGPRYHHTEIPSDRGNVRAFRPGRCALANPKSQIFKSQLLFIHKFRGFKS